VTVEDLHLRIFAKFYLATDNSYIKFNTATLKFSSVLS